jgi:S-adenosylmethionine:diacylglycerol 3-amino-3-carboxypropyl transferase
VALVFTRAWEDDRLDLDLLRVGPGERVLVVAAAGDAALALAATGAEVVAVDRNLDQLRLVALKVAAARTLPADRLFAWFEVGRDTAAVETYRRVVRPAMAPADAAWWDDRIGVMARGLHGDSGVGRSFARLGWLARRLVPGLASSLEGAHDPIEQQAYWRRTVQPRLFGPVTHALASRTPLMASLAPNRHELARMRAGGWSHGLVRRIDGVVGRSLVRAHPWWRPALTGHPSDPGHGAAWLDAASASSLAAGAGSVRLVHADLATALDAEDAGAFAAISVSNVPDWLDEPGQVALAGSVVRALAPGGRVLVRHVVEPAADRDPFATDELEPATDRSLVDEERTALYEVVRSLRKRRDA